MADQKWEYARVQIANNQVVDGYNVDLMGKPETVDDLLRRMGDAGWELSGIASGYTEKLYQLFFKRPA